MKLESQSIADNTPIPAEFAFCAPDPAQHCTMSSNRNPHLRWSGAPSGTRSFVVICHDPDVPSRGDDVNQEGRTVPASLPRVDFYHWVLVDLPATMSEIQAGEFSAAVTPRGKTGPATRHGARHGINDYTSWFAGDGDMAGDYFGYDGPCPPWNDALRHRYVFTVYALDASHLDIAGRFTGQQVVDAMRGHVLAQAAITGLYTLNPDVRL